MLKLLTAASLTKTRAAFHIKPWPAAHTISFQRSFAAVKNASLMNVAKRCVIFSNIEYAKCSAADGSSCCSHSYLTLLPSSVVERYLKKDYPSTKPTGGQLQPSTPSVISSATKMYSARENKLLKTTTCSQDVDSVPEPHGEPISQISQHEQDSSWNCLQADADQEGLAPQLHN